MSTTTDWLVAVSSAVAAVGTVGTLSATVVVLRRQGDDARRAQARRVLVTSDDPTSCVEIHNGSDQAVYGVLTWIFGRDGKQQLSEDQFRVIKPDGTVTASLRVAALYLLGQDEPWFDRVEVVFTDEAGHRWIREANGPLREARRTTWPLKNRARARLLNAGQRWRDRRAGASR